MNNGWLLQSGPGDAAFNMAADEALLAFLPQWRAPVLRFYGWTQPAATFGYFQKWAEVAAATRLRPLVRRPTGGGLVPHEADWTYSVAFPAGHEWHGLRAVESYRRVHDWLRLAFAECGVATELASDAQKPQPGQCFIGHEKFDLLWRGQKIAGAAQRRNQLGLLIQGSVQPPPVPLARAALEAALCAVAAAQWQVRWTPLPPDAAWRARVEELRLHKYAQENYNARR